MVSRKRTAGSLHLLTVKAVMAAAEGRHADGGGLYLAVRPGSVAWLFRYVSPVSGSRREMGLGPAARGNERAAGESLRLAREQAARARAKVKAGVDPIDDAAAVAQAAREAHLEGRRQAEAERATERWTLARCARDYHERLIEGRTKSAKHSAQWISSLENHLPGTGLWHRPITSIEPAEMLDALLSIAPHERARNIPEDAVIPVETVRRIRQRLEVIWGEAIFRGRATVNVAAAIKGRLSKGLPKPPPAEKPEDEPGFQYLRPEDARRFYAELVRVPGTAAACLRFTILTGARTGEVLGAAWPEFDLAAGTWSLSAARMKAKKPHVVFLSPAAIDLVRAQSGFSEAYVFPSVRDPGKPQHGEAMRNVIRAMGWDDRTTVHGFRKSFSTWANDTGAARHDVIEAALAHTDKDDVRRAYNKAAYEPERRALSLAWAEFITSAPAGLALVPKEGAR